MWPALLSLILNAMFQKWQIPQSTVQLIQRYKIIL